MPSLTTLAETLRSPIDGTENVRLATAGANWRAPLSSIVRLRLTGNLTYFVRTDGSDSNNGLTNTAGGAFLTAQHCFDVIAQTLDVAGWTVTMSVQNAAWTANLYVYNWVGGGIVLYEGNSGSLTVTGNDCFTVDRISGQFQYQNVTLSTVTSGNCVNLITEGANVVQLGGVTFGACASAHVICEAFGTVWTANNNYTVSGNFLYHWYASPSSEIVCIGRTITISGSPTFTVWATSYFCSVLLVYSNTYSGAVTAGKKYDAQNNGVIFFNGGTLPGPTAGTTATGGQAN